MGAFTPAGLKAITDAAFSSTPLTLFAAWHTADPGSTGANEYAAVGITRTASWFAHVQQRRGQRRPDQCGGDHVSSSDRGYKCAHSLGSVDGADRRHLRGLS